MRRHRYQWKPKPRYYGSGEYWIGIELEVEAPSWKAYREGLRFHSTGISHYAKYDGSISRCGWELVTHPIGVDNWKQWEGAAIKRWTELLGALNQLGYRSHDSGDCGMHVHISHSSFPGFGFHENLYPISLYWFARLINGQLVRKLSQRTDFSYCAQRKITSDLDTIKNTYRNSALNITAKTLEIRIFRGNLRLPRIRKNIETVIAGVEWARAQARAYQPDDAADVDAAFISHVSLGRSVYPNLYQYLVELDLITELSPTPADV